jgi:hypothetical protein
MAKEHPDILEKSITRSVYAETKAVEAERTMPPKRPPAQSKRKPAIHFASWTQAEKYGEPMLVATFSAHGKTEGTRRYAQAKREFATLDAVDKDAVVCNPPALSIEIQGRKACGDFLSWVKHNAPDESAAISATGIGEHLAEPVKKPAPAQRRGNQPPQQLSLDDSWAASVKPAGKPKPKGRGK